MQLNRINIAAVMPSAIDKYRQIGDMWERGMALLAWKLDGRGTVVVDCTPTIELPGKQPFPSPTYHLLFYIYLLH